MGKLLYSKCHVKTLSRSDCHRASEPVCTFLCIDNIAHVCISVCWVFREALVINLITRVSSPTRPADAVWVGIYGVRSRIRIW